MSKIHQAMLRAEKEGAATGGFKSGARARPYQGTIAIQETIPDMVRAEKEHRPAGSALNDPSGLVEKVTAPDSRLVALRDGTYDSLRDTLQRRREDARTGGSDLKAILFTGVVAGDGKSLTAANVSISISKGQGERVLLVDANLKAPSIYRFLGIDQENGLSGVLKGNIEPNEAIFRTDIANLYVVTAGNRVENSTELLNTRKMSDFLALAKKHFDWVLLDSPSLTPSPDADLLSSMVDAVVLITRGSESDAGSLRDGIQMLEGRNVLGVVLNDVDAHNARRRAP